MNIEEKSSLSTAAHRHGMYLLTPLPEIRTNVLTSAARRKEITDEVRALPFLGSVRCSRKEIVAGEVTELIVDYEVGASGIADSGWLKLCLKYYSDWDFQTVDPAGRDYVGVEYRTGSLIGGAFPESAATLNSLKIRYDVKGGERPFQKALLVDLEDGYLRPGDHIVFHLGDRRGGGPGTRVQTFVEDKFQFRIWVDPLGTSRMAYAANFTLDVVPGEPDKLFVFGPRLVRVGEPFALKIHAEDRWGNTPVDLGGEIKVTVGTGPGQNFVVPAKGWAAIEVPATLDRAGEAKIAATMEVPHLGRTLRGESYVDADDDLAFGKALYGDLHVHSNDSVGTNDNEYNFSYGRRIGALDFLGYTANDFQITDARWEAVVKLSREMTVDGKFIIFPGVEWCGTPGVGGDHNVVFLGDDTTLARCAEWHADMPSNAPPNPQHWPITMLYDAYEAHPENYLLIPHVGGRRAVLDWHHPHLERLIEVHSAWGPNDWFFEDAMRRGLRLGATGASDEHRARPGGGHPGANIFGSHGGLCGLIAPALSREAVGTALRARHTWATTGARMVAILRSGDHLMGDDWITEEPVDIEYDLLCDAGWEQMTIHDGLGILETRNLHREMGFADQTVRLRWGGARIKDRYRWATWEGRISVRNTFIDHYEPWALEHPEKYVRRDGPRALAWKTDTYGGSNGTTMTIRNLAAAKFVVEFRIPNYVHDNTVQRWEVSGADLLQAGDLRFDVGGIEMFVALERMTDAPLPRRLTGTFKAKPGDGASCVYVRARQFDGHEAWTSPLFFNFPQHRLDGVYGAPGAHGHDHEEGEHGHEHGGDGHRH